MTQEIEIEYKNLLTKDEFERILHHYAFPTIADEQTNYYFETNDFLLKENGSALRIREKAGKFVLTLKEPHPSGLLETHDFLTKDEALSWINGNIIKKDNISKQLESMDIPLQHLVYRGQLTTQRREVKYGDVLLVIDYSMYNGQSDYELEIEAPSKDIGIHFFNDVLTINNVHRRTTPNKIERFFASLRTR